MMDQVFRTERARQRDGPGKDVDETAHRTIGAAIEVHRVLGPGFLESVYENALSVELAARGIRHRTQVPTAVHYKGRPVGEGRIDFLIEDMLIVELKAVEQFAPIHTAQVISYLRATGLHLGLLLNFNATVLKDGMKRILL